MRDSVSASENLLEFFKMGWVDVFAALLTPTIAIFGAYIAFRQYKVRKDELNEKLFERRLAIVDETREFLRLFIAQEPPDYPAMTSFQNTRKRALFLFRKPTLSYLKKIYRDGGRLRSLHNQLDLSPAEAKEMAAKWAWLADQYEQCLDIFRKDVGFSDIA